MDCTSDITVTRQHAALKNFKNPLLALIYQHQNYLDLVYNNYFDEYLHFPIIEKQLTFRLANLINNSLPLLLENTIEKDNLTVTQDHRHIKLAKGCASYLLSHISENHSLAELAKTLGTNRNSLAVAFKSVYSCGVFTWLRQQRLQLAHKYLSSGNTNIQTIAYDLGFSDPANFSRLYKQQYGICPRYTRDIADSKSVNPEPYNVN